MAAIEWMHETDDRENYALKSSANCSSSPLSVFKPNSIQIRSQAFYCQTQKQFERSSRHADQKSKMSWQSYVDEHLMCDIEGTGNHLTGAAIIGSDGSVWAKSASFPQLKPEEVTAISKDFEEPGHLAPTGLFIGGTKYMVIQGEPGAVIRGKKGAGGICIKKTGQAMVFGLYDEPVAPGQCNKVVEGLGDYLVEQGL